MSFFDNPGMLAPPRVTRIDLSRGGFILACSDPLEEVTRCIGDWLEYWAARTPNALFLAERDAEGEWVRMTYAQVREQVGKLAQEWLDCCHAADARGRPVGTLHPSRNGLRQVLAAGHPRWFYPDIRSRTAGCGITRILEIIMIIKTRESCPAIVGSIHLPHCSCRCIFPCAC